MIVGLVDAAVTSALRRAVLRPDWPLGARMHGDESPAAVHLAVRTEQGEVVGACVLLPASYPPDPQRSGSWQLRGMATAPQLRGRGIGGLLVEDGVRVVGEHGAHLLWCQARVRAIAFYARHGFVGVGGLFVHQETGILHRLMCRELSRPPDSSD